MVIGNVDIDIEISSLFIFYCLVNDKRRRCAKFICLFVRETKRGDFQLAEYFLGNKTVFPE